MRRCFLALSAALALSNCSNTARSMDPAGHVRNPIGDLTQPAEVEIVHYAGAGLILTSSRAAVPMFEAPQGGAMVIFVAARARNLDGNDVREDLTLVDAATNMVVANSLMMTKLTAAENGWGEPELPAQPTSYAHLVMCPQPSIARDTDGSVFLLQLSIDDVEGRHAETSLPLMPICTGSAESLCTCECSPSYEANRGCAGAHLDGG